MEEATTAILKTAGRVEPPLDLLTKVVLAVYVAALVSAIAGAFMQDWRLVAAGAGALVLLWVFAMLRRHRDPTYR